MLDRRRFLTALGTMGPVLVAGRAVAEVALPKVTVAKDPSCGCCGGWVEHMRKAGFAVEVQETSDVDRVKARLGVPSDLVSCHTAEVGGYVVEGHVPAEAVKRLLSQKRQAKGLAAPGMPMGSPGMEMAGMAPDTYDVVLFGPSGRSTFARYQGERPV